MLCKIVQQKSQGLWGKIELHHCHPQSLVRTAAQFYIYLVVKTDITKINMVLYLEKDLYFVGVGVRRVAVCELS